MCKTLKQVLFAMSGQRARKGPAGGPKASPGSATAWPLDRNHGDPAFRGGIRRCGKLPKNFADLVKTVIPEHAREKPIELSIRKLSGTIGMKPGGA